MNSLSRHGPELLHRGDEGRERAVVLLGHDGLDVRVIVVVHEGQVLGRV